MKVKRSLLSLVTAFCFAVFLYLSASTVLAGGVNPGTPIGYKQIGPQVKGSLIIGWQHTGEDEQTGEDEGRVEVHLIVEGRLYAGVPMAGDEAVKDSKFLDPTPTVPDTQEEAWKKEIISWDYPEEIAVDNSMPEDVLVKVFEVKDISNLGIRENLTPVAYPHTPGQSLSYRHVVYCDVKVTFFLLVNK